MAVLEPDRRLRTILIINWLPGFALLLSSGIATRHAAFAVGIIPMTFSALFAITLFNTKKTHKVASTLTEVFLICLYIGLVIPHIVGIVEGWGEIGYTYYRSRGGLAMLATYASMPMLVNLCVHGYFLFRAYGSWMMGLLKAVGSGPTTCPHCQHDIRHRDSGEHQRDGKGKAYMRVRGEEYNDMAEAEAEEGTPRASIDDEAARLV